MTDLLGGSTALQWKVERPPEPLSGRAPWTDGPAEAAPGEIVGDLLCCHLQPEEGVHAREVPAQGGRARGIQRPVPARGPLDLEMPLNFEAAQRVASGAAV